MAFTFAFCNLGAVEHILSDRALRHAAPFGNACGNMAVMAARLLRHARIDAGRVLCQNCFDRAAFADQRVEIKFTNAVQFHNRIGDQPFPFLLRCLLCACVCRRT